MWSGGRAVALSIQARISNKEPCGAFHIFLHTEQSGNTEVLRGLWCSIFSGPVHNWLQLRLLLLSPICCRQNYILSKLKKVCYKQQNWRLSFCHRSQLKRNIEWFFNNLQCSQHFINGTTQTVISCLSTLPPITRTTGARQHNVNTQHFNYQHCYGVELCQGDLTKVKVLFVT